MKRNPTVDDAVRGTNDDALLSKCSAVNAGYIDDPFTKYFLKRAAFSTRRPPIINRGSYVRFQVIQSLISMFLDAHPSETCQIVSLGAGSDTRFFLMENQARSSSPSNGVKTVKKYFEIDFSEVTTKKAMVIKKNKPLSDLVGENAQIGNGGTELYGDKYVLVSGDFRTDFESSILPKLLQQGFDLSAPTLFLAEVVFVYLPPETSEALVKWVGDNVDQALFVVYEQLSGGEENGFTKVMVNNLGQRGITLPGLFTHPTLEAQKSRFLSKGFQYANALDVNTIWSSPANGITFVSEAEKERVSKLEIFDEVEEWQLFMSHYFLGWAIRDKDNKGNWDAFRK